MTKNDRRESLDPIFQEQKSLLLCAQVSTLCMSLPLSLPPPPLGFYRLLWTLQKPRHFYRCSIKFCTPGIWDTRKCQMGTWRTSRSVKSIFISELQTRYSSLNYKCENVVSGQSMFCRASYDPASQGPDPVTQLALLFLLCYCQGRRENPLSPPPSPLLSWFLCVHTVHPGPRAADSLWSVSTLSSLSLVSDPGKLFVTSSFDSQIRDTDFLNRTSWIFYVR